MNRRTRVSLLTATAVAAASALLGLPATASADDTVEVLVSVDSCAKTSADKNHERCYAQHLVTRRISHDKAVAGHYLRTADHLAGKGPAHGYSPAQLAKAYGVDAATAAGTQVVGIVDAYHSPDALAHLNAFNAQYGLPAETDDTFRVRNQNGGTSLPSGTSTRWAEEVDLDLQAVRGLCHTCKILLIEANDNSGNNLPAGVNGAAAFVWQVTGGGTLPVNIISNSWGSPETQSKDSANASYFNHPGKAITVSTGDDGWFGWDHLDDAGDDADAAPSYPAIYNTVVAVGGTTLKLKKSNKRSSETTWNRNGSSDSVGRAHGSQGAAGSGCSEFVAAATFQSAASGYSTVGCTSGKRSGVDIAALADPYTGYDVYTTASQGTRWYTFGGTSLSSPLIAAMWALAGGPGGTSYPAKNLYDHFALKASKRGVYDLKTGGNGLCGTASATTCKKKWGADPNTYYNNGPFGIDCQFGWTVSGDFTTVSHPAGSAKYQCHGRTGFDGVSGVGTPTGVTVFKPVV